MTHCNFQSQSDFCVMKWTGINISLIAKLEILDFKPDSFDKEQAALFVSQQTVYYT